MPIPNYAMSMIRNYRAFYKARYSRDTILSDEDIWEICNTVFDDTSNAAADEARVDAMLDKEQTWSEDNA